MARGNAGGTHPDGRICDFTPPLIRPDSLPFVCADALRISSMFKASAAEKFANSYDSPRQCCVRRPTAAQPAAALRISDACDRLTTDRIGVVSFLCAGVLSLCSWTATVLMEIAGQTFCCSGVGHAGQRGWHAEGETTEPTDDWIRRLMEEKSMLLCACVCLFSSARGIV